MFDSLSDRLGEVFDRLRRHGALTEADVGTALREIRVALLEADVALPVVRDFVSAVREKALGQEVLRSVTPAQMVVKIVHDHLVEVLGGGESAARPDGVDLNAPPPVVLMLVGLQGSGKTTTAAKIARRLKLQNRKKVLLASLDVQRPAAQEQLAILGRQIGVTSLAVVKGEGPVAITRRALQTGRTEGYDVVILDTAGRLHVNEELMLEVAAVREVANPHETLLVADAMTGQDAVNVAEQFGEAVAFDGVVMTKLDGDARGGAALSVKAITGKPILFASTGEKLDQFERFHPDRMAQRILGMGDVMTLIEKAESAYDEQQTAELERKLRKQEFGLDDFLDQIRQVRRLGPLQSLLGMIPGMGKELRGVKVDEREFDRLQSIILSMTPEERRHPEMINGSRRLRIARGSGTNVQAVKQLIKQFEQMRKVMRQVAQGRMPDLGALMRQGR
jgi:signal recognition particle subunit SRP54